MEKEILIEGKVLCDSLNYALQDIKSWNPYDIFCTDNDGFIHVSNGHTAYKIDPISYLKPNRSFKLIKALKKKITIEEIKPDDNHEVLNSTTIDLLNKTYNVSPILFDTGGYSSRVFDIDFIDLIRELKGYINLEFLKNALALPNANFSIYQDDSISYRPIIIETKNTKVLIMPLRGYK